MAQSNLKIVIDAINQAQGDLNALKGQLAGLEDSGKKASSGIGEAGNAFEQLTGVSLTGVGAIMSVGGALKFSLDEAMSAERQMAATAAVIKSTGGAAGITVEQVMNLASSEQALTGIQDDVVGSGVNMLLTFKNIGGDTMPRATRAMEDMAAAMSGGDIAALDLKGTAIQLGKALNDPIQGISALSRVGVTFTAEQESLIKNFVQMGDVAGAQNIILKELESEFGGMAEAMGETNAGKIQKAKNAIGDLGEAIGTQLLPVLGDAAEAFTVLMTAGDRAMAMLEEHSGAVVKTSNNYDEYRAEVIRAAESTGMLVDAQGNLVKLDYASGMTTVIKTNYLMSESGYDAAKATNETAAATQAAMAAGKAYGDAQAAARVNIGELTAAAKEYNAEVAKTTAAHNAMTVGITADAISITEAEKKRAEVEQQLADLNADIAKQGPVRQAWDPKDLKASVEQQTADLAKQEAAQAKLAAVTAELAAAQKKKGESDLEFKARTAGLESQIWSLKASIAGYDDKLTVHTITVGGATEAQIKQRDALQATLDEMQRAAEIDAAKSAFAALGDALKAGTLSESDYRTAMMTLNDATGLFSEKALATATNSALMVDGIRKAKVPEDVLASVTQYGSALGSAAQQALGFADLQAKIAGGKNVTGEYAGGHAEKVAAEKPAVLPIAEIPAQPALDAYFEKLSNADALQANVGTFPDVAAVPVPALTPVGDYIAQLDKAKMGQDGIGAFPPAGAIAATVPLSVYTAQLQVALDMQKQIGNFSVPTAPVPTLSEVERAQQPGFQSGADFVVPAGYPNDSFGMRVSSGERVTVVPAGGGNTHYHNSNFNTTISDPRTGAAFMAWLRQQQQPSFERG